MTITLKQAENALVYMPHGIVPCLTSPPGIGKSTMQRAASNRRGAHFVLAYAGTMEPFDVQGLQYLRVSPNGKKCAASAPPSWIPLEDFKEMHPQREIIIVWDDLFQAPLSVQRPAIRATTPNGADKRMMGEFPIMDSVDFWVSGNRIKDRAGAYQPETFVINRMCFLEVTQSADEWVHGSIGRWVLPEQDGDYTSNRVAVERNMQKGIPEWPIAFVQWSKCVTDWNDDAPPAQPFTSPRSLETFGRIIRAAEAVPSAFPSDVLLECGTGTIGQSQAIKAMAFKKLQHDLPNTDDILKGKEVPLPAKPEVLFTVAVNVLRAATAKHMKPVVKLISNMSKVKKEGSQIGVEPAAFLAYSIRDGKSQIPISIMSDPEFMDWLNKEQGRFFKR